MRSLQVLNQPTVPPPYPAGWYVVAFSEELRPGGVLTRRIADQELVLFRTQSGEAAAVDPFCPHMGAHLGVGSRVEGETLRCPMHAFCFDARGQCVSTPYGTKIPPKAKARTWALRERGGILFVYYDQLHTEPTWDLPFPSMDGWSPVVWRKLSFRGHPQETSENSVDLGHFSVVHGYEDVTIDEAWTDGPTFHTRYRATRPRGFFSKKSRLRLEFKVYVHGLGFSYVDVLLPEQKLQTRQFVLSTPVGPDQVELRAAMSFKTDFRSADLHPLAALIPRRVMLWILKQAGIRGYVKDVLQDVPLWSHKTFVQPPALAEGDGPVGRYRQWARQFYPDAAVNTEPAPVQPKQESAELRPTGSG